MRVPSGFLEHSLCFPKDYSRIPVSVLAPSPSRAAICFPLANERGNGPVCYTWEVSGSKEAVLGLKYGDHITPAI